MRGSDYLQYSISLLNTSGAATVNTWHYFNAGMDALFKLINMGYNAH